MVRINLCNWGRTPSASNSTLPLRTREKEELPRSQSMLQIHPLETEDGVLIKIDPPKEPELEDLRERNHVPLDLVLSIDVSGSMGADAPVPAKNGTEGEHYGLSVLDLVRHAAKTILETLDDHDRLGIVTFSTSSKVVRELTYMTPANKAKILKQLDALQPLSMTNLWHGIRDGLSLFNNNLKAVNDRRNPGSGRVPALLVLTDGMPNHQCPNQGYVAKLRQWSTLPASIHTFGFGYSLRSGLLKSIAEVGGGNYSFIPDAGMITTGDAVEKQQPFSPSGDDSPNKTLYISLGNLQYGQSREIYLSYNCTSEYIKSVKNRKSSTPLPTITAVLKFHEDTHSFNPNQPTRLTTKRNITDHSVSLPPAEIAYHISRSSLISFISKFFPLDFENEHQPLSDLPDGMPSQLTALVNSLPAVKYTTTHPGCKSLLIDLCGLNIDPLTTPPSSWTGQIALALTNTQYYFRWGKHYLPSLAGAHARQICQHLQRRRPKTIRSPLPFIHHLQRQTRRRVRPPLPPQSRAMPCHQSTPGTPPPPIPRRRTTPRIIETKAGSGAAVVATVVMYTTPPTVKIGSLRRGARVLTPRGGRKVAAVMKTPVRRMGMTVVQGGRQRFLVTGWHPVRVGEKWVYPQEMKAGGRVRYTRVDLLCFA
ncbi:uncharacterized protein PODANS_4_3600 [Podospora anserina S mat+]|uniref:Podospora anserina S mat+ genomic DNA chromosome 4, supercontig 4 n=1 Tax=Podospora anserina (strain S / ATCC MYA-4624 / DSM 980 / FGSC 10383) TaxID=515849 RepID=B2AQN8_PODAN|nr:uncharacterized protein PODANS_4_3600 [Podospora anserina S mat+]CAP66465.1 unnamed protein product [Podospora anserina S mat+]